MPPLRRHQLVYLSAQGWRQVLGQKWDDEARDCLAHWAAQCLPLVVTKQAAMGAAPVLQGFQPDAQRRARQGDLPSALSSAQSSAQSSARSTAPSTAQASAPSTAQASAPSSAPNSVRPIALGLPAPAAWNRRKLMLLVPPSDIAWFGEFPPMAKVLPGLAQADRRPLQSLNAALGQHGLSANVYGSAGWQALTGLRYLHAASDLDLWIGVQTAEVADLAVHALQQHAPASLRVDGELVFPDGSAIAWREWAMWRAGQCAAVLVKRLRSSSIERQPVLSGELAMPLASIVSRCAA